MFHTIYFLISNLNKKEGYLLGLSVLYIFKKEIFFPLKSFDKVIYELHTHSLRFFCTDINESVSLQRIHQYLTQVVTLFSPIFTVYALMGPDCAADVVQPHSDPEHSQSGLVQEQWE